MFEMANVSRKRAKAIEALVKQGKCLLCPNPAKRRGLCDKCSNRFYQRRYRMPDLQSKARFEADCIKRGLILPSGQASQIRSQNPFREVG